jgi:hypothetical protein
MSGKITRYAVFTIKTQNVVSGIFINKEKAEQQMAELNAFSGHEQYSIATLYYKANPLNNRYVLHATKPEGCRTPITPPPSKGTETARI